MGKAGAVDTLACEQNVEKVAQVRGPSPCEVLATLAPPAPPGSGRRHLKIRFLRACTLLCGRQSVSAESILRARCVEAKQRPVFLMAYGILLSLVDCRSV